MTPNDPGWCARLQPRPASRPGPAAPPADPPLRFFERREVPSVHECELCGTVMYDHSCKIVCPNCGYKRDCSDP